MRSPGSLSGNSGEERTRLKSSVSLSGAMNANCAFGAIRAPFMFLISSCLELRESPIPSQLYNCYYVHRSNRQSTFSPLTPYLPLPKYFESEWSYAQYRIPTQSSHISLSATSVRSPTSEVDE